MTKFFHKFKKTLFLAHFAHFGGKMFFPKNLALSHTTSYGFLTPCQNLGKTNEPISRICLGRWSDRQMERRTGSILQDLSGYRQRSKISCQHFLRQAPKRNQLLIKVFGNAREEWHNGLRRYIQNLKIHGLLPTIPLARPQDPASLLQPSGQAFETEMIYIEQVRLFP